MNPLERSLVEKAGYSNGWENIVSSTPEGVVMSSARHKAETHVRLSKSVEGSFVVGFPRGPSPAELAINFLKWEGVEGEFMATGIVTLGALLRRAAELAISLPNHAADLFEEEAARIDCNPPSKTEAIRLVKQRIGQNLFRQALIDYWGGACAVTGLDLTEALRASHAKPWTKCETNLERLDVFNGFLLAAHLDALFDQGLLTFEDDGSATLSPRLTSAQVCMLRLDTEPPMKLRWISPSHRPYLAWHRSSLFHK